MNAERTIDAAALRRLLGRQAVELDGVRLELADLAFDQLVDICADAIEIAHRRGASPRRVATFDLIDLTTRENRK